MSNRICIPLCNRHVHKFLLSRQLQLKLGECLFLEANYLTITKGQKNVDTEYLPRHCHVLEYLIKDAFDIYSHSYYHIWMMKFSCQNRI